MSEKKMEHIFQYGKQKNFKDLSKSDKCDIIRFASGIGDK